MASADNTLEYIISAAKEPQKFAIECEMGYNNKIKSIARQIFDSGRTEIVMIAGPSSSGKTTSAERLKEELWALGLNSHTLSLDDFYLNNCDAPRFPDGTFDFETVEALDTRCFQKVVSDILENGCADVPQFDFLNGTRKAEFRHLEVSPKDVIIVEGLHALNPKITAHLPRERLLKIYVSVSSRICGENGDVILSKRNLRFIRRIVRDYKFRGNSVEKTYTMWAKVRYGEDTYLFPFKDNADIKLNTIHFYEICVLKNIATQLLGEIEKTSKFYGDAQKLIAGLSKFPSINPNIVPKTSLLREFIG